MIIRAFNLTNANKANFCKQVMDLDCDAARYTASVKPHISTRSLEQNSRLWKLYTELGLHIGETPRSVHELMGYEFLRELKTINGKTIEVIKSTTDLTTAQMAAYQEQIEMWANLNTGFWFEDRE